MAVGVWAEPADSLRSHTRGQSAHQQYRPPALAHHPTCGDLLTDVAERQQERLQLDEVIDIARMVWEGSSLQRRALC